MPASETWPPPRVGEVVSKYLLELEAAGASTADLTFAEEFLMPERSGKSEDELIMDIRAAWVFVRDVAKRKGAKL